MAPKRDNTARTISWVMAITLIGKVMGLYRDRLLAVRYSVGMEANAFFTASRIPRVFFDAVFASAIAACFIPVFSEYLEKQGRKEAERFAGQFVTVILMLTGGLSVLGMLFPQPLVALFADYADPATTALAVSLTRVLFPTVLFSGAAFSLVGVLQAQDRFTAPALMSAVSNLAIIVYFLFLDDKLGIYGLAGAYLLGWLLQALIQLPSLKKSGFVVRPSLSLRSEGMKKVFALMGPVMVSTWVQPINLVINSRFGSRLYDGGGVAVLEYSTNLYLVIAGTFVLSVTNVIFPRLSRMAAGERQGELEDTLRMSLHGTLFFVLPMVAGLMLLSRPMISFLYGGGQFDGQSVALTSSALTWLSLGMVGYAVQNILSRAYFARQKGLAPLVAGACSIGANLALCAVLVEPLGIVGLALSSAASSTVYALLLLIPMQREYVVNRALMLDLGKMLLSALLMAAAVWAVRGGLGQYLPSGKLGELILMGACVLAGALVYFIAAALLELEEASLVRTVLGRKKKRG